jgi:hypothetical protein
MKSTLLFATAWLAALLSASHPAAAVPLTQIGDPIYDYEFYAIPSDGQGGVKTEVKVHDGTQTGGALNKWVQFTPPVPNAPPILHAEVFSNVGGVNFWTKTFSSPTNLFPAEDIPVGGIADLRITQTFQRDDPNGTFKMKITDLFLRASELAGPTNNKGLFGSVEFDVSVFDSTDQSVVPFPEIDSFHSKTTLEGRGLNWKLTDSGPLSVGVTDGSEMGPSISVDLLQPYEKQFDLSTIGIHEFISVEFHVRTTAWDTVQFDSVMQAFGRDPLSPARSSFFEYEGFTPMRQAAAVPEPETCALMLLGLAALAWRKLRA